MASTSTGSANASAPFPVELAQRCIESTTAGIVLDPFLGSGTTAIAAKACDRDWIGIEISKDYCTTANERIGEQCVTLWGKTPGEKD